MFFKNLWQWLSFRCTMQCFQSRESHIGAQAGETILGDDVTEWLRECTIIPEVASSKFIAVTNSVGS